jgi:adenosylhomocysteine nucleosidase
MKNAWRLWAKAIGEKEGTTDREADKIAMIRTIIVGVNFITCFFIIAGNIHTGDMMKDIIIMALEHEAPKMAKWENVFFTGVGKVNAALTAGKLIERYQPRTVWNFGTAGGIKLEFGLHEMKNFVERDKGKCPESINLVLPTDPQVISFGIGYTCSTGDNFVTDPDLEIPAHVVDMEAYAIGKACLNQHVDFKCFKYVSDQADEGADTDWLDNIADGEEHYIKMFQQITGGG